MRGGCRPSRRVPKPDTCIFRVMLLGKERGIHASKCWECGSDFTGRHRSGSAEPFVPAERKQSMVGITWHSSLGNGSISSLSAVQHRWIEYLFLTGEEVDSKRNRAG